MKRGMNEAMKQRRKLQMKESTKERSFEGMKEGILRATKKDAASIYESRNESKQEIK